MNSVEVIRNEVVAFVLEVLERPQAYGPSALEVQTTLNMLLWFLQLVDDNEKAQNAAFKSVQTRSMTKYGSFARFFWKSFDVPQRESDDDSPIMKQDQDAIDFLTNKYREVFEKLGIAAEE